MNKKLIKIISNISFIAIFASNNGHAQETPLSEIFFLDLGIVIEPSKGDESYTRKIDRPSEEVSFKIKKVESGSIMMASSKELLSTLDRVNERLNNLEKSFKTEMQALHDKNTELAIALDNINNFDFFDNETNLAEKNILLPSKQEDTNKKVEKAEVPIFNKAVYMTAIFAYQREDYEDALGYFSRLNTSLASNKDKENILYWMADSHQRLGQYDDALSLLERIMEFGDLRIDDALIKKGLLHRKLGDENLALAAFNDVVSEHPNSEYLRLAQMELKKIDK
jgi:TolA-binding protein